MQCCEIALSPLSFFFIAGQHVDSVSTAGSNGGSYGDNKLSNFETASMVKSTSSLYETNLSWIKKTTFFLIKFLQVCSNNAGDPHDFFPSKLVYHRVSHPIQNVIKDRLNNRNCKFDKGSKTFSMSSRFATQHCIPVFLIFSKHCSHCSTIHATT